MSPQIPPPVAEPTSTDQPLVAGDQSELSLGQRAACLVLNHPGWIKRRVESVKFLDDGSTRHQISFDLVVPPSLLIDASEVGASATPGQVILPLTFMGKGTLVGLDLRDIQGAPLPSAGFGENGQITVNALCWLLSQLGVKTNPENGRSVLEKLVAAVVYSSPAIGNPPESRKRDHARRAWFDALLRYLVDESAPPPSAQEDSHDPLQPLYDTLADKVATYRRGVLRDMQEETRRRAATTNNPEKPVDPEKPADRKRPVVSDPAAQALIAVLMLLSTVCDSYIFAAVVPHEQASGRTIVKVSFNTDVSRASQPQERSQTGLARLRTRLVGWWQQQSPSELDYPVVVATRSAASVHVDLDPAAGTQALDLKASAVANSPRVMGDPINVQAKVMGDRIHLNLGSPKRKTVPLITFRLGIWSPARPLRQSCLGAAATTVLCGVGLWFWVTRSMVFSKFLTADNVLATLALVLALWLATIFDAGRHRITQSVGRPVARATARSVALASAALVVLSLAYDRLGSPPATSAHLVWPTVLLSVLLVASAANLLLVCHWSWLRRQHAMVLDKVRAGGSVPVSVSDGATSSGMQQDDAAEVAAFECVSQVPDPEATLKVVTDFVEKLTRVPAR